MRSLTERLKAIYEVPAKSSVPDANGVVRRSEWSTTMSDEEFDVARSVARAELARIAQEADDARKAQTNTPS